MPTELPLSPRRRPTLALLLLAAAALIGFIWWAALDGIRTDRAQAIALQRAENSNLALAHAERATYSLLVFDQLLRLLRDDVQRGLPLDSAWLRQRVGAAGIDPVMVHVVTLIDASGAVIATTGREAEVNYADRDYFRAHRDAGADDLRVGVPHLGRVSQRWGVTITRGIRGADGRFAGVAYLSLDPAFFATVYRESERAPDSSLALIGLDGITRARRNGETVSFGGDVSGSQLFQALRDAPDHGSYIAPAASDGQVRLVAYRRLAGYPLVVVVASAMSDVLAAPAARERRLHIEATAGTLGVLLLAALLAWGLHRNAQAVAALERSERRYRLLFEHSLDAVLRTAPDGTVQAANRAACRLFQMSEAELCAAGRAGLVDTSDPRLPPLLAARARDGRANGLLRMRRGDGSLFEAELSASLYTDSDGSVASSMIVRDVTERQRAEAERDRLQGQLRESQRMEAIGTLAGGIAHDFNNILAAIIGNTAMARQDLGPDHPAADALAHVSQAALRARTLVQQILTFSRPKPEQRQVEALQPLVREALALLRATLPATVRLEVALAGQPLHAVIDATQLQQVVMNLCTNAWQALPARQGTVRVSLQAAEAGPLGESGDGAEARGAWARLQVQDDGVGMDAETRARIFDPFFTTKPVGQGTGLGLAVVHGIVAAHGGRVTVDSRPGHGATFDVWLPLAPAPAVAEADDGAVTTPGVPLTATEPAASGRRLMYIDDDEVIAITVERLMARCGHHVDCYSDPARALAVLRARPQDYELVVSDFNMPGMSGLDVATAMRREGLMQPVIITTGFATAEVEQRAREARVFRVLRKEFIFELLAETVDEALAESTAGAD